MRRANTRIHAVPTNVITGFLGTGKTSTILHLLRHKPSNERWAVLVNEFGEIGVDGSLFEGQHNSENNNENNIFIREVPGGCMCCAAGLPMQVALNQLLKKAKPDRLLIEPTGLGHPKEVLDVLRSPHYRNVLALQNVLTLVDARQLADTRYTEHATFNQQIAIADIIVGNKLDLYQEGDKARLTHFISTTHAASTPILFVRNGEIPLSILETNKTEAEKIVAEMSSATAGLSASPLQTTLSNSDLDPDLKTETPLPENGFIKAQNSGEGFHSEGWRFHSRFTFQRKALLTLLHDVKAERIKAVLITNEGNYGYNLTPDGMEEVELVECKGSRIEIIARHPLGHLETQIFSCIAVK